MKRRKSYPPNKYLARIIWWKKHIGLLLLMLIFSFSFFSPKTFANTTITDVGVDIATKTTDAPVSATADMTNCPANQPYDPESRECRPKKNHLKPCPPGKTRNPATKRCLKEKPSNSTSESSGQFQSADLKDSEDPEGTLTSDPAVPQSTEDSSSASRVSSSDSSIKSGVKSQKSSTSKTCAEGQELNPLTNRCKKIPVPNTSAKPEKTCPAGQELNPLTNRCKKSLSKTLAVKEKTCSAGYEINPKTNRCIKSKSPKVNDGATHPLLVQKKDASKKVFIAGIAIVSIIITGISYLIFQFRKEIARFFKKYFKKVKQKELKMS